MIRYPYVELLTDAYNLLARLVNTLLDMYDWYIHPVKSDLHDLIAISILMYFVGQILLYLFFRYLYKSPVTYPEGQEPSSPLQGRPPSMKN
jgi:hypothetical protein